MGPAFGVVEGVASAEEFGPVLVVEQSADVVVALDDEKTGGTAKVLNTVAGQQLSKRGGGAHDGVSRRRGKVFETNLDGPVFDRLLVALGQEQYLAIVGIATIVQAQDFQVDFVAVKLAKRGGHVPLVDE